MDHDSVRINAGWRTLGTGEDLHHVTRWFVCYRSFSLTEVAGVVAGQTGKGGFLVRSFHLRRDLPDDEGLWVEGVDSEESPANPEILLFLDEVLDVVFTWNDTDVWSLDHELLLAPGREVGLSLSDEGLLVLRDGDPALARKVCERARLAARPQPQAPDAAPRFRIEA